MQILLQLYVGALQVVICMRYRELLQQPHSIGVGMWINQLRIGNEDQMMWCCGLWLPFPSVSSVHEAYQMVTREFHSHPSFPFPPLTGIYAPVEHPSFAPEQNKYPY